MSVIQTQAKINKIDSTLGTTSGTLTKSGRCQLCLTGTSSVCWCKPLSPSAGQGPPTKQCISLTCPLMLLALLASPLSSTYKHFVLEQETDKVAKNYFFFFFFFKCTTITSAMKSDQRANHREGSHDAVRRTYREIVQLVIGHGLFHSVGLLCCTCSSTRASRVLR